MIAERISAKRIRLFPPNSAFPQLTPPHRVHTAQRAYEHHIEPRMEALRPENSAWLAYLEGIPQELWPGSESRENCHQASRRPAETGPSVQNVRRIGLKRPQNGIINASWWL